MQFEIIGAVAEVEVIAEGVAIRQLSLLEEEYGRGSWRKLKGTALVRWRDGRIFRVELHWYEAHGIGRKRLKVKRFLD